MTVETNDAYYAHTRTDHPFYRLDQQALRETARTLHAQGALEDALAALQILTEQSPADIEAWHRISDICLRLQLPKKALKACEAALSVNSEHTDSLFNTGVVLSVLNEHAAALHCYDKVLAISSSHYGALRNRPLLLAKLSRQAEAQEAAADAVSHYAQDAWIRFNQGDLLLGLAKPKEAANAFRQALALSAEFHRARYALSIALAADGQIREAYSERLRALAAEPGLVSTYQSPLVHDVATGYSDPSPERVFLFVLNEDQSICKWGNYSADIQCYADLVNGKLGPPPLDFPEAAYTALGMPDPVNDALRRQVCRQIAARTSREVADIRLHRNHRTGRERLRIAYAAGCFSPHPNARLMGNIYARHDRSRFDVFAYGLDQPNDSPERLRVKNGVDVFREVAHLPSAAIAQMMVNDGIDILIDLSGYMLNARPAVMALKPAPIQISYMDFMGTQGAPWIDYTLLDRIILLPEVRDFWDEHIAYLPNCSYHCEMPEPLRAPQRVDCGLPTNALILGALHRPKKLDPCSFSVWMALLKELPEAVLWLLEEVPQQRANLCAEALEHGVNPERLIFAPPKPNREHLARYQLVDIHLDTLAYNGHTTTIDALGAGVPVVTAPGTQVVSRVAASMLAAHGLKELIASTVADYKRLVVRMARDTEWRNALREKVAHYAESNLFCPERRVREIETAYAMMWERHIAGLPPEDFDVPAWSGSINDARN